MGDREPSQEGAWGTVRSLHDWSKVSFRRVGKLRGGNATKQKGRSGVVHGGGKTDYGSVTFVAALHLFLRHD